MERIGPVQLKDIVEKEGDDLGLSLVIRNFNETPSQIFIKGQDEITTFGASPSKMVEELKIWGKGFLKGKNFCPEYQDEPLSKEEIEDLSDQTGYLTGNVCVALSDLIDNDLEGFLDIISEKLVGSSLLMDVNYKPVGLTPDGCIVFSVTGDPSEVLDL